MATQRLTALALKGLDAPVDTRAGFAVTGTVTDRAPRKTTRKPVDARA